MSFYKHRICNAEIGKYMHVRFHNKDIKRAQYQDTNQLELWSHNLIPFCSVIVDLFCFLNNYWGSVSGCDSLKFRYIDEWKVLISWLDACFCEWRMEIFIAIIYEWRDLNPLLSKKTGRKRDTVWPKLTG